MRRTIRWRVAGVIALLGGLCSASSAASSKSRYQEEKLEESGTIIGVVKFDGKLPKPKMLRVKGDDDACHKDPIPDETLVVSKDKRIKWAVVSLQKIKRGKPFPKGPLGPLPRSLAPKKPGKSGDGSAAAPAGKSAAGNGASPKLEFDHIDQKGCRFDPHVALVPERGKLRILNSDGILHNVHSFAKFNKPFNKPMQAKVKQLDVSFRRRERIKLKCDVHLWMQAWIDVAEHPYYAVTGDDGTFKMEKVAPGKHTIEVWHETLGPQKKEVTVKAGEKTQVEFVLEKK